jgi:hypothetical protein
MSETAPAAEPFEPICYVVKGQRFSDGELSLLICPVEDGQPGKGLWFPVNKQTRRLHAGYVYNIPTSGTSIRSSEAKYLAAWSNHDQATEWQTEERAAQAMAEHHKKPKDAELLEQLRPLRKLYASTIGTGRRTALELTILAAIRTPLGRKEK